MEATIRAPDPRMVAGTHMRRTGGADYIARDRATDEHRDLRSQQPRERLLRDQTPLATRR